jgi:ABC-type Na+ efflux pump permease subunit
MARLEQKKQWTAKQRLLMSLPIIILIAVVAGLLIPGMVDSAASPEEVLAKKEINRVVEAAEQYRAEHYKVYTGMDAKELKAIDRQLEVVEGLPTKGAVGLTDYNSHQIVLVYRGESGRDYKANVRTGDIEFDF